MINLAVQLLATQLNQHLRRTYDLTEDVVVTSNLVDVDGNIAPNINNKLVIFLTNIQKDSTPSRHTGGHEIGELSLKSSQPLYFNLYIMMTANFTGNNYPEALKFLSSTVSFFQRHALFNHQTAPELDRRIEKLILDIENLSIQDLSNLWGSLGGKYLPSILYKVRMVTFDAAEIVGRVPTVSEPKSSIG
jgi:uncharacterized protein DUF4255